MPAPTGQRLSLADLMILIGATGFGLGCFVLVDNNLFGGQRYFFGLLERPPGGWTSARILERTAGALAAMLPLFGGWTFALPILVARRPRPTRARWSRRAGLSACLAALAGMVTCAAAVALAFGLRWAVDGSIRPSPNFWSRGTLFDDLIIFAGVAVAATWSLQIATGRWRPSPDAIDRIGRSLGLLWLAAGLVFAARQLAQ